MSGRALIVVIVGIITISSTIFLQITGASKDISANTDRAYMRHAALNIAQSAVNVAIRRLTDQPWWRSGVPQMDLLGGKASIALVETTYNGASAIEILSTGTMGVGTPDEHTERAAAFVRNGYIPLAVKAALTTTHMAYPQAGFVLDGRDHNADGTLRIPGGTGTLAVWTLKGYNQTTGATVGGTLNGIDYVPSMPASPNVIQTFQTWPGGYPSSPDSLLTALGFSIPEGTLEAVAKSGAGGSQYVTNPVLLNYPLRGVTYVELPDHGMWDAATITGEGILIVHNEDRNAILSNVNNGPFVGFLIGDEIVHINCTIIGAIVSMGGHEDDIVNGPGQLLFSNEAISRFTGLVARGLGDKRGTVGGVLAWKE
ncbi:MAG: hypothetical protein AB1428_08525 [Bacteroidota bacterium]